MKHIWHLWGNIFISLRDWELVNSFIYFLMIRSTFNTHCWLLSLAWIETRVARFVYSFIIIELRIFQQCKHLKFFKFLNRIETDFLTFKVRKMSFDRRYFGSKACSLVRERERERERETKNWKQFQLTPRHPVVDCLWNEETSNDLSAVNGRKRNRIVI